MIPYDVMISKLDTYHILKSNIGIAAQYAAVVRNEMCLDLGNPNIIHVVTDFELQSHGISNFKGIFIIGEAFTEKLPENIDYAVFPADTDTTDLIYLCSTVYQEYERFLEYKRNLTLLCENNTEFKDVFQYFSEYYDNPVTFGDRGGNVLYHANVREDFTEWDDEINFWLKLGYVPFEYQKTHGVIQETKLAYGSPEPVIREKTANRRYRRMICRACRINNEYNNAFAVVEVYSKYKPFDKDALKYTASLVTDLMPNHFLEQIDTPRNYVLKRLIHEVALNPVQITELFRRNHISFSQYYMIAVIREHEAIPDEEKVPEKTPSILKLRYRRNLSNYASTIYEDNLVVLLQADSHEEIKNSLQYLMKSIFGTSFYIGYSEVFEELSSIRQEFLSAVLTVCAGMELSLQKHTYSYDEMYFQMIIRQLNRHEDTNVFVQEKLKRMLENDEKKNTEYARTVYEYILCDKNISRVSKKMLLHRNTVIYRINKAKEFLDIDFEDVNAVFQLFFSYKCLESKKIFHK